jgi:hypothetical protein
MHPPKTATTQLDRSNKTFPDEHSNKSCSRSINSISSKQPMLLNTCEKENSQNSRDGNAQSGAMLLLTTPTDARPQPTSTQPIIPSVSSVTSASVLTPQMPTPKLNLAAATQMYDDIKFGSSSRGRNVDDDTPMNQFKLYVRKQIFPVIKFITSDSQLDYLPGKSAMTHAFVITFKLLLLTS